MVNVFICMAMHDTTAPALMAQGMTLPHFYGLPSTHRAHAGDDRRPTIRREDDNSEDDRYSGEYYSGDEFYENDSMLSGDSIGEQLKKFLKSRGNSIWILKWAVVCQYVLTWQAEGVSEGPQTNIVTKMWTMILLEATITLTVTMTMTSSHSTVTPEGHQKDDFSPPHHKVRHIQTHIV
ncbi:hypothetical protein Z043_112031 [Scleropages formosus]|uniref:Uncharacterized protein n=1 Tax=Scleropages formosus TaxID=113540 RepID=A0A0P7UHF3_SCLFO|nr:hypothetical protein Z043_112031 [Scleropages formosus]